MKVSLHVAITIQQFLGSLLLQFLLDFRNSICFYGKDHSVPSLPSPTCARWKDNLMCSSPVYKGAASVLHGLRYVKMHVKLRHRDM